MKTIYLVYEVYSNTFETDQFYACRAFMSIEAAERYKIELEKEAEEVLMAGENSFIYIQKTELEEP